MGGVGGGGGGGGALGARGGGSMTRLNAKGSVVSFGVRKLIYNKIICVCVIIIMIFSFFLFFL